MSTLEELKEEARQQEIRENLILNGWNECKECWKLFHPEDERFLDDENLCIRCYNYIKEIYND